MDQTVVPYSNAQSMKYGYSRKQLEHYCKSAGIRYLHRPALGIASEKLQELNGPDAYRKLFREYARRYLPEVVYEQENLLFDVQMEHRVAIMCFEADPGFCHRSHLADSLAGLSAYKLAEEDPHMEQEIPAINRAFITIRPKEPYYTWVNAVFKDSTPMTAADKEATGYAISDKFEVHDLAEVVKPHFQFIFEMELFGACTDPDQWPAECTWKLFNEWFSYHVGSMVWDPVPDLPLEHEAE